MEFTDGMTLLMVDCLGILLVAKGNLRKKKENKKKKKTGDKNESEAGTGGRNGTKRGLEKEKMSIDATQTTRSSLTGA